MILGFTTGPLGGISIKEKIRTYKDLGCRAIELGLVAAKEQERWDEINKLESEDLAAFEHVFLHAPGKEFIYGRNEDTKRTLENIQKLYEKFHFAHAVIHPDRVEDWEVFKEYGFPIAVENMDHRKEMGRTIEDLRGIFSKVDVSMVLDVNHCYANDSTLELAKDMYVAFRERISEIHLSGFRELHDPLHETKQIEIIQAVPNFDLPIIIEGSFPTAEDIRAEFEYIKNNLSNPSAI
jgi:hypothetical protein